jgi:hypothetical protein
MFFNIPSGTSDSNFFEGQKLIDKMPIKDKRSGSKGVIDYDFED